MPEAIVIKAEPATLQVRTVAMGSAPPEDHVLVIGVDDTGASREFHGACSCAAWSASHHPDKGVLIAAHSRHYDKRKAV